MKKYYSMCSDKYRLYCKISNDYYSKKITYNFNAAHQIIGIDSIYYTYGGLLFRPDDLPAATHYFLNGNTSVLEYYNIPDKRYRFDHKPSRICYYEKTSTIAEESYTNERGVYHRDNNPAVIFYNNNGEVYQTEWWNDGKLISFEKHFI
jgi:hypothetical protein